MPSPRQQLPATSLKVSGFSAGQCGCLLDCPCAARWMLNSACTLPLAHHFHLDRWFSLTASSNLSSFHFSLAVDIFSVASQSVAPSVCRLFSQTPFSSFSRRDHTLSHIAVPLDLHFILLLSCISINKQ